MPAQSLQSSGVQFTDRRRFYLSPNVTKELWPVTTPFTTVIANQQTMTNLDDTAFKLFEHRNPWRRQFFHNNGSSVTIGTDDTDSGAVTIDNITGLNANADASFLNLEVEVWSADELTLRGTALISNIPSTTTIKLRNLDGATSIATVDNDIFRITGNAHGEGASSPEPWADELRVVFNFTQEFRTPYELTKKLRKAVLRGETKELERVRKQKAGEHKMQKERAFLNGRSPIGTNLDPNSADTFGDASGNGANHRTDADGNIIRTTMGITTAIEKYGNSSGADQNIFTIQEGSYHYGNYVDDMEKCFQYLPNSGVKRAFAGRGAMSYWSKMTQDGFSGKSGCKVQLSDSKRDTLGFHYRMLATPHGIMQLIPTPGLDFGRNKWMLVVDDDNLFHAIYEPPEFRQNIKTDNAPSLQKDEFFSDEGIGMTLIESHSLWKIV